MSAFQVWGWLESTGRKTKHHMLAEIYEQPNCVRSTLDALFSDIEEIEKQLVARRAGMIYFTGSGTSYHACLAAHYVLSTLTGLFASTLPASEFASWVRQAQPSNPIMVAISQSGESIDLLNAVRAAKHARIKVVGITNSPGSKLTRMADFPLVSKAGPERALAATKSFTSTLMTAYLLTMQLAKSRITKSTYRKSISTLEEIPERMKSTLASSNSNASRMARRFREREFFFILGSGPAYPTALEGALKLKECCNVHAEGFATREFLHGPMQLVDHRTPVIIIREEDDAEEVGRLIGSFTRFGAPTVVVQGTSHPSPNWPRLGVIDGEVGVFSPLTHVLPLQLFAYHCSIARGLNPDKPEKLTKVVK